MSLTEFIMAIKHNIEQSGGDSSALFNFSASDAVIVLHNIMVEYAKASSLKCLPIPSVVINKLAQVPTDKNFTQFKFCRELGLDTVCLYSILDKLYPNENISINDYSSCLSIEIYN